MILVEIKESKSVARRRSSRRPISMRNMLLNTAGRGEEAAKQVAKNVPAEFATSPPTYRVIIKASSTSLHPVRGRISTPVSTRSHEDTVARGKAILFFVQARHLLVKRDERHEAQETAAPFTVVVIINLDDLVQRAVP